MLFCLAAILLFCFGLVAGRDKSVTEGRISRYEYNHRPSHPYFFEQLLLRPWGVPDAPKVDPGGATHT